MEEHKDIKEHEAGVIEGPFNQGGIRVAEDMVMIPLVDGEDIFLTKEEFKKIGRTGAIIKYAARFVYERMKSGQRTLYDFV